MFFNRKYRYFAYGANLLQSNLEKRIGKVKFIKASYLIGYNITFNYGNSVNSFANLVEDENSIVFGTVYLLTQEQIDILDYYEGTTLDNKLYYSRVCELIDNKPTYFYISKNCRNVLEKPVSYDYLNTIIEGYKKFNQPLPKSFNI